jgi:hypothetical protein
MGASLDPLRAEGKPLGAYFPLKIGHDLGGASSRE